MRAIALLFFFILSIGPVLGQEISEDLEQLTDWMTGEFDSSEQAAEDSSYYNITLKMTRIWPDKTNGIYIYVEQAVASTPDEPYRQRVYFLSQIDEFNFSSDIYELKEPEKYIGTWQNAEDWSDSNVFDLKYKEGCTVFLNYDGFQYTGQTNKGACSSSLRGAAYATSEVVMLPSQLTSWDRGYDASDKQVWGAEKGPYIFKKK